MSKSKRKLGFTIIFVLAIGVLLVPALWERFQIEVKVNTVDIPPPPLAFRDLHRDIPVIPDPNTAAFFASLYRMEDSKIVESSDISIEDLGDELPRAWLVYVEEFTMADDANALELLLRNRGLKSFVTPNRNAPGPYRVMVGPMLVFDRVTEVRDILQNEFGLATTIMKFKP